MKIAVFGGTFDPVHTAHIGPGRYLLDSGYAEKILYLPAPEPPHKTDRVITPYQHRRNMLSLAMEPGMEISEIERERTGKSYTVDTMRILTERYSGDSFAWVIGSDSLRQLHRWHEAERLVRTFSFLIFARPDGPVPDEEELRQHWSPELTEKLLSEVIPHTTLFPGSSTEIREKIRTSGPDAAKEFLHPAVLEYIRKHNLYQKE